MDRKGRGDSSLIEEPWMAYVGSTEQWMFIADWLSRPPGGYISPCYTNKPSRAKKVHTRGLRVSRWELDLGDQDDEP